MTVAMRRDDHPLYSTWEGMRQRCNNKNHCAYPFYGGRGISICSRWDDFWLFLADVGDKPSAEYTLDRFPDADGDYQPGNVRWADKTTQSINQRVRKDNASGHTGIFWFRRTSSWMVGITHHRKAYHIGYFKSLDDAVAARAGAESAIRDSVFKEAFLDSLALKKVNSPFSTNSSGVRGVSFNKLRQTWHAFGHRDNKPVHIGSFLTLEEARESRDKFIREKHDGTDNVATSGRL